MRPTIAHLLTDGKKEIIKHKRIGYIPLDMNVAREALLTVKKVFDEKGASLILIYGTLLGAVRDGDIMAWDKDIDLGCFATEMDKIYPAILELMSLGFELTRTNACGGIDSYFQLRLKKVPLDFAVMSKYKENQWRWGRFREPNDYYSRLTEIPFLGTTFTVPKDYERWLRDHYNGDSWKMPTRNQKSGKMFKVRN